MKRKTILSVNTGIKIAIQSKKNRKVKENTPLLITFKSQILFRSNSAFVESRNHTSNGAILKSHMSRT